MAKNQFELIQQLADICAELGWEIAIPTQDEIIPGLIVGNPQFIDDVAPVITEMSGADTYEVFSDNPHSEGLIEITEIVKGKKYESYH